MSYSFSCWSHPGKLLRDHVGNVYENGMALADRLELSEELRNVLRITLLLHDAGKASRFFQKYIRLIDQRERKAISESDFQDERYKLKDKTQHARISALWTFSIIEQWYDDPELTFAGYAAVLRHHGNLDNLSELVDLKSSEASLMLAISEAMNYEELNAIIAEKMDLRTTLKDETIADRINSYFNSTGFKRRWKYALKKKTSRDLLYRTNLIYSILLAADKGECIFDGVVFQKEPFDLPANLVDHYKQQTFGTPETELNLLRERVYRQAVDTWKEIPGQRFYSINVPTGIGKTLTAFNLALKMLEQTPGLEKMIYCLPFTSVIDQNAEVLEQILEANDLAPTSDRLLINHHLAEPVYKFSDKEGENETDFDQNRAEYLITQFESHLNVTTFYQLLHGLLSHKNRELRKFHSLANSVIILDEVQSIPSKYWPLVKQVFKEVAEMLNITFVLVTATLPMIFDEERGEITELVKDKQAIFSELDRILLDTSQLGNRMTIDAFGDHLIETIDEARDRSYLIICNTVRSSKELYKLLKGAFDHVLYLSTSIPPIERLRRIKTIKKKEENYIVVSTQLVEAGVDIDLDVVYRDLAPLDAIFQSAGRCNRNDGERQGEVRIVELEDDQNRNRRFGNYIYHPADLNQTQTILQQREQWREGSFFELANEYYGTFDTETDASNCILEHMANLNYASAFDSDKKNDSECVFELIEELPKIPVIVAFEPEAEALLEQYQEAIEAEYDSIFEKRQAVGGIRKKLAQYIVSIPEEYGFREDGMYHVITEESKDFSYNCETGINYREERSHFIC